MAHSVPYPVSASAQSAVFDRVADIPWCVWFAAIAVTSTTVGLYWDISWHTSIGRDTFWTPAHLCIHFGAIVAGLSSVYLILSTTFGKNRAAQESSVRVWGFYGPLGTLVSLWGGLTMLTSAPFDDWWHNAFGLDVQILSPPHVVLVLGIFTVGLGGLFLIIAEMNRANAGEAEPNLSLCWLHANHPAAHADLRVHGADPDAQRDFLPRAGTGDAADAGRDCACIRLQVGGDEGGGNLSRAVPGGTVAGALG